MANSRVLIRLVALAISFAAWRPGLAQTSTDRIELVTSALRSGHFDLAGRVEDWRHSQALQSELTLPEH